MKFVLRLAMAASLWTLAGCAGGVDRRNYENEAGEALLKEVIQGIPALPDGPERVYTVVLGPEMVPASSEFMHRLKSLKIKFVSGYQLSVDQDGQLPVDPNTGLSPITLQYSELKVKGAKVGDEIPATAAWAYKDAYQRRGYVLVFKENGQWEVIPGTVIEEKLDSLPGAPSNPETPDTPASTAPSPAPEATE